MVPLAIFATVVTASIANADVTYTDTAAYGATGFSGGAVPPPIPTVGLVSLDNGRVLTNQFGPQAPGTEIRTIGAVNLGTITTAGVNIGGSFNPSGAAGQLVGIFGVNGTIAANGVDGNFSAGGLKIVVATAFMANDPSTWGFNNTALATYSLKPPENIIPGNTLGIGFANPVGALADDVNVSGLNTAVNGFGQGLFLFEESPLNQMLFNSDSTLAAIITGLGGTVTNETLIANIAQQTTNLTEGNIVGLGTVAIQNLLDSIAQFAFAKNFATYTGNNQPSDFNVLFNGAGTGLDLNNPAGVDFIANLGGNVGPGLQANFQEVPEPASMLVWGIGMGIAGVMGLRRRRNKAKA